MALYGGSRDISLFRHVNRELIHDIISQQCVLYKYDLEETKVNIYGEASQMRKYYAPVILYCIIERADQTYSEADTGVGFGQGVTFRFLRDDLQNPQTVNSDGGYDNPNGANVIPEIGDIILYQEGYYQIDSTVANQYFVGKNPDYPNLDDNGNNPLETDLANFGYNQSIICATHYVPADKVGLTKERM